MLPAVYSVFKCSLIILYVSHSICYAECSRLINHLRCILLQSCVLSSSVHVDSPELSSLEQLCAVLYQTRSAKIRCSSPLRKGCAFSVQIGERNSRLSSSPFRVMWAMMAIISLKVRVWILAGSLLLKQWWLLTCELLNYFTVNAGGFIVRPWDQQHAESRQTITNCWKSLEFWSTVSPVTCRFLHRNSKSKVRLRLTKVCAFIFMHYAAWQHG